MRSGYVRTLSLHDALPIFGRLGGLGKCTPPFRTEAERERMWRLPMVVSDHSPSTLELKQGDDFRKIIARSEEHTSELQSRFDLVCRLLLEKKKQQQHTYSN